MKLEMLKKLSPAAFRRKTGVKRETFNKMVELVKEHDRKKKIASKGAGRPHKLTAEERVLMALEYYREYRTYFNIGTTYGISESNAYENIKEIEELLAISKEFRLPGKKGLLKSDHQYEVVLIDATESPIERPKKNSVPTIQEKRSVTRSKHSL